MDPIFNHNLDEDFDFRASGITRSSFCSVYYDWIQFCYEKRIEAQKEKNSESQADPQKSKPNGQSQSFHHSQTDNLAGMSSERTGASQSSSDNQTPSPQTAKSGTNDGSKQQTQPREIVIESFQE